jgi:PAS domain S-box-containing protein
MLDDVKPALESVVELDALAACWLAMAQATTLDEIEAAALTGLLELIDVKIAYTARRGDAMWSFSRQIGLAGDFAGVAIPEEFVPYAEALLAGDTICYENLSEMGPELAQTLAGVGLGSLYAVPIMKVDLCVGTLAIGRSEPSVFSPRDRALVRLFTSHLGALLAKRDLVQSLETLAESVPAIVLRTEPSGWINWYNHRWYSFTGQTREEAAGWGWQTAHHPEDFLRVMEEWPKALATGQPIEIEFRLRRHDGIYHWHLARVEPVRDDKGTILSWYGTVVDIEAQKQALERTQRVAEALQQAFLPQQLPQRHNLRLDANYVSAEQDALVGGDWYDAFELPDGRMGFSIGDVAGHGLAASLAVGNLRQAIFTLALRNDDPGAVLSEVDRILRVQEPGTFVTALVGFIDRDGTTLRYATAGHPPPLIAYRAEDSATMLPTGGPPLGVTDDLRLTTHTIAIETDMVVVLYTDGMTEFSRDALAGEARLRTIIPTLVGNTSLVRPAQFLYASVLDGAVPQDDAALLVLQFSVVDSVVRVEPPSLKKEWRFHASDARAAHVARREIGAYLFETCGETEDARSSELIIGELLANTVEHAPGLVHLTIEWTGNHFVLIVRDSGPGIGVVRTSLPADLWQEGSRGLFLVHALASDVTILRSPEGGAELRVVLPLKPFSAR